MTPSSPQRNPVETSSALWLQAIGGTSDTATELDRPAAAPSDSGSARTASGAGSVDAPPATSGSTERSAVPLEAAHESVERAVGSRLGSYVITGILGRGGMGIVYEGEHIHLKRRAAVKVLPENRSANPRAVERFLREAQLAARLNHPNVVGVYDFGEADGAVYIAMELIRGGSCDGFLASGPGFTWREATRIVADCCRGMAEAHAAGLIHRDIKPANILLETDGRRSGTQVSGAGEVPSAGGASGGGGLTFRASTVKLSDFGLAKSTEGSGTGLTGPTKIVGTPDYLSPEQARCRPMDARTDVYSMGATYFALLTGRPPYERPGGAMDVILAHINDPAPDPRDHRPELPEACSAIVRRAMAKDPAERHQSAAEMLAELEALLSPARPAAAPAEPAPPPAAPTRGVVRWVIAAVLLAAVGGPAAWYAFAPAAGPRGPEGLLEGGVPLITPGEADGRVDTVCEVELRVGHVRVTGQGNVYLYETGADHNQAGKFGIKIDSRHVEDFRTAGIADFEAHYQGRTVRVTGLILKNKDRQPIITAGTPAAIRIVGE
jgi:urea transport system substrate-binding protein